jgi:hypothetical protein
MSDAMNGATFSREALALASVHAQKLRDEWQCRLLAEAKGIAAAVVLAMLGNLYYEAIGVMLRVVFPDFRQLQPPLLTGFATIAPTGQVVCDYVDRQMVLHRNRAIYDSEAAFLKEFRELADKLKFDDADRKAMFRDLSRWVSRDMRLKPAEEAKANDA